MNFWESIFFEFFFVIFQRILSCISFISFGVILSLTLVLELADPT